MSETPSRPSRPNRFGLGFLSISQIVLLVIALVFFNYIASQNIFRGDFSRTADYTLSSSTKNFLRGGAIAERETPVRLKLVYRRTTPQYERVRALLEEYARVSAGKVELEIIDPLRSPDRTQQFAAEYELVLAKDFVLIDARPDEAEPIITQGTAGTTSLNPHVTLALADEMTTYAIDEKGERRPKNFRGEELITSRLVAAVESKPKVFLFLADKSRVDAEGKDFPWSNLATTLRYQNIELVAANLSGLKEVPEAVEGLAIIAPRYDFTDEEIETLENYWNRPRSSLLILLQGSTVPAKLKLFLRSKGITPREDRVVSKNGGRLVTDTRGVFTKGIPFLSELAGQSAVFEGASASLEVRENAEDLAVQKIAPVPLFQAAPGHWGEMDFGKNTKANRSGETLNKERDHTAPIYIAAAVTRGAANDDRFAKDVSRMIVISNTDFLDPQRQRAENVDFLSSSANWLAGRNELTGLSPRSIGTYKLPLLEAQVSFINRLNLFFIPIGLLLIGSIVFSVRRS